MFRQIFFKLLHYLLTGLAIFLVSCSIQFPSDEIVPETPELLSPSPVNTPQSTIASNYSTAATSMAPLPTITLKPTQTANPTSTPDVTVIPTPGSISWEDCPQALTSSSSLLLNMSGSILYSVGRIRDEFHLDEIVPQPGIWAISAKSAMPGLVYESSSSGFISPDGSTLLVTTHNVEDLTQEVVFYSLADNTEVRLVIPYEFWFQKWLTDGRVQFEKESELEKGTGEIREVLRLDPITQEVDGFVQELHLPDFAFNISEVERFGLFYGYHAIDPTGELILYSAQRDDEDSFEIRLLNVQTGEVIWQLESVFLSSSLPQWSDDGSHVIFDVSKSIPGTNSVWSEIISLNRSGQIETLPPQPFPLAAEGLSYYSRSPNGRYLFYLALANDVQTFSVENRAFIVDIVTGQIGEICDPGTVFIASIPGRQSDGYWLRNGQLVYRVLVEKGGQVAHSLRVLDIPSWTAQEVFEAEPGYGVNVFGQTSIEYPQ